MHTHIVFFWLKEPNTPSQRDQFKAGLAHLVQDPNVLQATIGEPAATARDVVENGYDFGLVAQFDDLAAHDAYQIGPNHAAFLDMCQDLWSNVQVYDLSS